MVAPVFHQAIPKVFRVKAITLYQTWASLVLWKLKRWETRSWRPQMAIGDLLVIHAGKKFGGTERQYLLQEPYRSALLKHGITDARAQLPFGAVLCIAKLVSVRRTEDVRDNLTWMERSFGNYADGRFAWELEVVYVFDKPVPMQGAQGIFPVEFDRNPMLPKLDTPLVAPVLEVLPGGKATPPATDYKNKSVDPAPVRLLDAATPLIPATDDDLKRDAAIRQYDADLSKRLDATPAALRRRRENAFYQQYIHPAVMLARSLGLPVSYPVGVVNGELKRCFSAKGTFR